MFDFLTKHYHLHMAETTEDLTTKIKELEQALDLYPDDEEIKNQLAIFLNSYGNTLYKVDNHKNALIAYNKAISMSPHKALCYFHRGLSLPSRTCFLHAW